MSDKPKERAQNIHNFGNPDGNPMKSFAPDTQEDASTAAGSPANQQYQQAPEPVSTDPDAWQTKPRMPVAVITFVVTALVTFAAIFANGYWQRLKEDQQTAAVNKAANAPAPYPVTTVKVADKTLQLTLPGNIQAIQEFSIFARCDGYLKDRLVDIGDRVKKGQLLVEIDAPELGKQLKRANADYKQAQAQLKSAQADLAQSLSVIETNKAAVKRLEAQIQYSTTEVTRYDGLAHQGAISAELRDEKKRDLSTDNASLEAAHAAVSAAAAQANANREKIGAAKAAVDAAVASVEEIQDMTSFQKVVAPCDGVITTRNVDAGALVSKGSSTNNEELLKMARTETLRVFVYIPQSDYQGVYVGMPAKITVAELPNQTFAGKITHVSGGLDPSSRTLQTEIQIPNRGGKLMPGMFAQVILTTFRKTPPVIVPDSAIVVKPEGQFVLTLSDKSTAHYQRVEIGRDFGKECEILHGLDAGARIIVQPTTDIQEGQAITPS